MDNIPPSLRTWFQIHFVADMIFGIPLLFVPAFFLSVFGYLPENLLFARLVGAALIGIGGVSFLTRHASFEVYTTMLNLKIIWSLAAIFGICMSLYQGAPRATWLFLIIFIVFSSQWIRYRSLLSKNPTNVHTE